MIFEGKKLAEKLDKLTSKFAHWYKPNYYYYSWAKHSSGSYNDSFLLSSIVFFFLAKCLLTYIPLNSFNQGYIVCI